MVQLLLFAILIDFQQIEFRLIAHLSADEKLITMLQVDTVDIFISLAAKL